MYHNVSLIIRYSGRSGREIWEGDLFDLGTHLNSILGASLNLCKPCTVQRLPAFPTVLQSNRMIR
jgi:hypothetical protein